MNQIDNGALYDEMIQYISTASSLEDHNQTRVNTYFAHFQSYKVSSEDMNDTNSDTDVL